MLVADRAKAIKTTATINESPTDKLIRELREENKRLMEMLKSGGMVMPAPGGGGGVSNDGEFSMIVINIVKQIRWVFDEN